MTPGTSGAPLAPAAACTQETAWTGVDPLTAGHLQHTATLLLDGSVLVVGGFTTGAERFQPSTGTWTSAGNSLRYRREHTATRLVDGRVLLAGGAEGERSTSAEVYDPATRTWSLTGSMTAPRRAHSATLLSDGSLLVAGGTADPRVPSAERYDPASGTWTPTGPLLTPRSHHTATLLPDGRVLITGGEDLGGTPLSSVEVYDPATGTWTAGAPMSQPRLYHTATALADGSVLVVGGMPGAAAASAEVYQPATRTWAPTASLLHPRRYHTANLLPDGSVLVVGGYDASSGILTSAERYTPGSASWCQAPSLALARYGHTAVTLRDGRVLVSSGFSNSLPLAAELHGAPGGCDSSPPGLTLYWPPEGFLTRESWLTLNGSVDDAASTVTVNGTPVPLAGLGFTAFVPLTEGLNRLQVIAEDACHNRTTLVRTVRLDSTRPSLSFLQPSPDSHVEQAAVDVLLTYMDDASGMDPAGFRLLLDGVELPGALTYSASTATGTVTLSPGPHTLEAHAADLAGNIAYAQVQVLVEPPDLLVTLTRPAAGADLTAPASVRLAATASASTGVIDHVDFLRDGAVVGSSGTAPYQMKLEGVPAGTYVFRARAVDDRGRTALSAPATVTVTPLELAFTEPVPGALVNGWVLVKGTFKAPAGSGVTVNDQTAALSGNTFLARVPVEPEGATVLTATLVAPEGQSLTQTLTVAASGEASPFEVRVTPASGFAPLQVQFTLTNRLEQPVQVTLAGSGPQELPAGGQSTLSATFPAGVHAVNVDFVEASGRRTRQSFVIEALDESELDQKLRAIWSALNEALIAGDTERALAQLSPWARDTYAPIFDELLPDMPSIIASYSPLQQSSLSPTRGEYAINRTLEGVDRIFFISFERDRHGVWHLSSM